jgi:hypothetical protein
MTVTILSIQRLSNEFCSYNDRGNNKCVTFEGKQYLVYDYYTDPFDGEILACIPALDPDVACCEINTTGYYRPMAVPDPVAWSLMGVVSGPGGIPDYFRYVVLDGEVGA